MLTTILSIIAALVGVVGGVLERRYSDDAIKERNSSKRDKEIAGKDHIAKSKRLSDLVDD